MFTLGLFCLFVSKVDAKSTNFCEILGTGFDCWNCGGSVPSLKMTHWLRALPFDPMGVYTKFEEGQDRNLLMIISLFSTAT